MRSELIFASTGLIAIGLGYIFEDTNKKIENFKESIELVDSTEKMIDFVKYVDSMHIVEDISSNYIKMEQKNEELETQLEGTKHELEVVKHNLEVAEKIIEVYVPADTISSDFKLLPISQTNSN